jgi:two-component system, cell cycle response regulator
VEFGSTVAWGDAGSVSQASDQLKHDRIAADTDRVGVTTRILGRRDESVLGLSRLLVVGFAVIAVGIAFELLRLTTGVGGPAWSSLANNWVYMAVEFAAVGVCAARAASRREHRLAWVLMTVALGFWSLGDLLWAVWLDNLAAPPFPSPADVLYLLMYPCMYVALMAMMRSRMRDAATAQWLDGAVLTLAVGAIAATLVSATSVATGGRFIAESVTVAYPVLDCILLMLVIVAYTLMGWRPGANMLVLGVAIILMAGADIMFVENVAGGMYVDGTLLNVLYLSSFSLFAVAAWIGPGKDPGQIHEAPHTISLTLVAASSSLALLVLAAFVHVAPAAVGLAAGALVLATVRSMLTYLENVRILRMRAHEATTDVLTGLWNRRQMIIDLEESGTGWANRGVRTLAFFDLNGFKRYNDTFGHPAGDALLSRLGGRLEAVIAERGSAYRLGGDEFCMLLDGRYSRDDRLVAQAASALSETGRGFSVTTAVGVAIIPDEAISASAALRLADERMYADKGRAYRSQTRDVLIQLLLERAPGLLDHVSGVTDIAAAVAADLGLDSEQIDETLRAAELHDVGKLAIPDAILNKPGPLDPAEWEFMRQHPIIGERILAAAPALGPVAKLVRASHERWDGGGYPDGLRGEEVPIGARIVAVCDAYEAMTADRVYQSARAPEQALAELHRNAGSQFDPAVVVALERHIRASLGLAASGLAEAGERPR